jgi:hypothetical protein
MSLDLSLYVETDTGAAELTRVDLFDRNITHNVSPMWSRAGVYEALYKSRDKTAADVVDVVRAGVQTMEREPDEFRKLNPPNGWGDYNGALAFLRAFLTACEAHPKAKIGVWA